VLYHAEGAVNEFFASPTSLFHFGFAGVQFFFVLSGYIIYHVHHGDIGTGKVLPYARKRLVRIYPIYIFTTLLLAPFWLWVPSLGEPFHKDVDALLLSLALIPQDHPPHLGVAWTLIHEMLFYIVFGILILNRRIGWWAVAAWLAAVAIANLLGEPVGRSSYLLSVNNLLFGLGMLAAWLPKRVVGTALGLFVIGNIGFLTAGVLTNYGMDVPILAFGLAAFLLVMSAEPLNFLFRERRALLFLGDASYSIYLIHYPVISVACKALLAAGISFAAMPIVAVLGILGGIILHLTIERPVLRFFGRRAPGARHARTEPAG
jgi:peptidoglycan/LPS O-acetylase OafA/YrhL